MQLKRNFTVRLIHLMTVKDITIEIKTMNCISRQFSLRVLLLFAFVFSESLLMMSRSSIIIDKNLNLPNGILSPTLTSSVGKSCTNQTKKNAEYSTLSREQIESTQYLGTCSFQNNEICGLPFNDDDIPQGKCICGYRNETGNHFLKLQEDEKGICRGIAGFPCASLYLGSKERPGENESCLSKLCDIKLDQCTDNPDEKIPQASVHRNSSKLIVPSFIPIGLFIIVLSLLNSNYIYAM